MVYLPVMALAPFAFPMVFGKAWEQAGVMLALMSPYLWLALIVSPLSRILLVRQRAELKLAADVVCLALPVLSLWLTRDQPVLRSVSAFSFSSVVAYLFYFAMIWVASSPSPGDNRPIAAGK
jgi:O-antigen/teichoic acid export membrane protein